MGSFRLQRTLCFDANKILVYYVLLSTTNRDHMYCNSIWLLKLLHNSVHKIVIIG